MPVTTHRPTPACAATPVTVPPTTHRPSPTRPRRRRLGALVTGALLALAAATSVAQAPTASAHDELTGTVPADGSTVATAPGEVVLHFSEAPVTVGLAVRVTGPTGDVQDGAARIEGADVVQPVLRGAPAGTYRVAWRVTGDDGHASSGELAFTAAAGAPASTAGPRTAHPGRYSPSSSASTPLTPTATQETAPAVATSATTSSGSSPVTVVVVALAVVVLAGLALLLARRARADRSRG